MEPDLSDFVVKNQFIFPPSQNYRGPDMDPNPFEAHFYPFVDINVSRGTLAERMRECREWIDNNATGAAQVVIFGQRRNSIGSDDPMVCRYFFTDDKDATLFKLFNG